MKIPMINDMILVGPDTMRPPRNRSGFNHIIVRWHNPSVLSAFAVGFPPSLEASAGLAIMKKTWDGSPFHSIKSMGAIFAFPGNRGYNIIAAGKRKGNGRKRREAGQFPGDRGE